MKTTFNFFGANKTRWSGAAIAAALMIGAGVPATSHALVLTDTDAICTSNENGGNDTKFLSGCQISPLTLLYKANRDNGSEEGTFTANYSTAFNPATEAEITWGGTDYIECPTCYLVAKDGDSTPNWFLFDLDDFSWDGQETISIDPLFFKDGINQAFSHVSIWGTDEPGGGGNPNVNPTPEPGVLLLMGAGLLGLGMARRRKPA